MKTILTKHFFKFFIFQFLVIIVLCGCEQQTKQNVVNVDPQMRYSQRLQDTGFMATLSEDKTVVPVTINGKVMFNLANGQSFIYFPASTTAMTPDGQYGHLSVDDVKRLDAGYFKFNFFTATVPETETSPLFLSAKKKGINLNALTEKIMKKDTAALHTFLAFYAVADETGAKAFPDKFWQLINFWMDNELSSFTINLNNRDKRNMCNLLLSINPVSNPKEYYKVYYPKTLELINKFAKPGFN